MKTTMKITAYISMYSETRFSYDDQGYNFSETLATDEIVRKDFIKTLEYDNGFDLFGDNAFDDMYEEMVG